MKNVSSFQKMKQEKEPIAMLTAYDYPSALLAEEAGVDLILVGDSLGMTVLGYDSTVPVTLEDMLVHTKAVKRGAKRTFIVTDMPFMTYHGSVDETIVNARRLMQDGGASALKLEGGGKTFTMIENLVAAGVPVMAHLGLTPQSAGVLGGYKVQGKDKETALRLLRDAKCAEASGAFGLVLECVPAEIGREITKQLTIPVIGIGAGAGTDGQVLVYHDVLGYGTSRVAKFVKTYTDLSATIRTSLTEYIHDVKEKAFPEEKHSYAASDGVLEVLKEGVHL